MTLFKLGKKGEAEYEGSRFFGDPAVPEAWAIDEPWPEDCWFLCQICMSDIDMNGYLYFFYDEEEEKIRVYHTLDDVDTIYEECNEGFDLPFDIFSDYPIEFGTGEGKLFEKCDDGIIILSIENILPELSNHIGKLVVISSSKDIENISYDDVVTIVH